MRQPTRTVDLRRLNRQTALRHIYFNNPISRMEVSQRTKLSPATVTNMVSELLAEGIVHEAGAGESDGGRPRTMLAINPHYGRFVGVDLGETHVKLEMFDLALHKLGAVQHLLAPNENSPEDYVNHIASGVTELLAQTDTPVAQVLGVGVGVPGIVHRETNVWVATPLWGWRSVPFLEMLQARVPQAIFLDNGAKAMTLAESWFGAGRGVQDLVVALIGTGIGAGVITQGALYRGATNGAGEWGHSKIVLDGRPCRCGSRGCLEAYAGAPGIIAALREQAPQSPWLESDNQLTILNALTLAAEHADPVATEVMRTTAHYLGAGLANLVNLFNPERILLGGWAGVKIGPALLNDLREFVARYALPVSLGAVTIDLCELGEDAVCMGAACLVLDGFLSGELRLTSQPA